jgi:hypothetical protein
MQESSNMIQNIKVKKPLCYFCKEKTEEPDDTKPMKNQNILIYPCLCQQVAHRACLKQYIIDNQVTTCPTCKSTYAVGRSSISFISQVTPSLVTAWIGKFVLFFLFILLIVIFIIFTNGFSSSTSLI